MQRTSLADAHCSIARTLEVVGEWWTPLVLRDLFAGMERFDDLQRDLGVSTTVLTGRLNHLVDAGVVERHRYSAHANRFAYRLTEKGRALYPILLALMAWGDEWADAGAGPPVDLVHTGCGERTSAVPHCSSCGEPLPLDEVEPHVGPGARKGPATQLVGEHLAPPIR
jgi:DNA-binding HxlR family transcriptional regulator